MAITNAISNLFGQSPIKPMQEHMAVANQTAELLVPFLEAVIADDWEQAENIQQQISQSENDADEIKMQLRRHLPKSLFLPVPRSDLLELLSMQDRIANCAKDIAGIMLGRQMAIPKSMTKETLKFVRAALDTINQALKAIDELDELLETGFSGREVKIVEKLIDKLNKLEHKTDKLEIGVRASLFKLETDLPPVDVIFFYRVIDSIGELADRAQQVGNRLQILLAR